MLAVFLSNKLISTDAVVPLMLSVKRASPGLKIRFYSFHEPTCRDVQTNIVLWDALTHVGEFVCLGCSNRGLGRLAHRVRVVWHLFILFLWGLAGRLRLLHFKQLNEGAPSWLARLFDRKTVFMESNCWGYHKLMIEQIGNIGQKRVVSAKPGRGSTLVGFSHDWPELAHPQNATKTKLVVPSTHLATAWQDFVQDRADDYIKTDFARAGLPYEGRYLVFILGYFGKFRFFDTDQTMLDLFRETLDVLNEHASAIPVLIKPHVITDMDVVHAELAKRPNIKAVISNLHPAVLSTRAVAFIANYYSTTFADAHSFQVPTIEYTGYNRAALELTKGGSMRPELVTHFVNSNRQRFVTALDETISRPGVAIRPAARDEELEPVVRLLAS